MSTLNTRELTAAVGEIRADIEALQNDMNGEEGLIAKLQMALENTQRAVQSIDERALDPLPEDHDNSGLIARLDKTTEIVAALTAQVTVLQEKLLPLAENGGGQTTGPDMRILIARIIRRFLLDFVKDTYPDSYGVKSLIAYNTDLNYSLSRDEGCMPSLLYMTDLQKYSKLTPEQVRDMCKFIVPGYMPPYTPIRADFVAVTKYLRGQNDPDSAAAMSIIMTIGTRYGLAI